MDSYDLLHRINRNLSFPKVNKLGHAAEMKANAMRKKRQLAAEAKELPCPDAGIRLAGGASATARWGALLPRPFFIVIAHPQTPELSA